MNIGIPSAFTLALFVLAAPAVAQSFEHRGAPEASKSAADDTATLLNLAEEWVKTWNEKDVDRMQQLQADDVVYGVFGDFLDGRVLLDQLRKTKFFGMTYDLTMAEPRVRVVSADSALVFFKLAGKAQGPKGPQPYRSLFTLVYQRRGDGWTLIHVHDSDSSETSG